MSVKADITAADGWFVAEDKSFVFTIQSTSGGNQNITGWTIQWKLAATQGGAAILTKTATPTSPSTGVCTVTIASADTIGLSAGSYFYTLRRTDTGQRSELAYGGATLQGVYVV